MEIIKGIQIVGPALFIKKEKALIVGDLHIGQERIMQHQGMLFPIKQYEQINKFMESTLEKLKPNTIIINGDLKHDFGKITDDEWNKITLFLKNLKKYSEVIVIAGNHDKVLQPITDKLKIEMQTEYIIGDIYICHGDKIPSEDLRFKSAKTIIIGHEHPAIRLTERMRTEIYKCYLKGKITTAGSEQNPEPSVQKTFHSKQLIVMPSVNPISEGSDILTQKLLSPFLKKAKKTITNKLKGTMNLKDFECTIIDDNNKPYFFGMLKDIEKI